MIVVATSDRYLGSLFGLAVGDAIGAQVEFSAPGSFEPVTEMEGGGPFGLNPGEFTDDTSMALCLAASLVELGRFDAHDQMSRYRKWLREGYMSSTGRAFDVGEATAFAISRFERTSEAFSGSTDPRKAGNGSIMRLAPVPLAFAASPRLAVAMSGQSSITTHGCREAVDCCRYLGALIVGAVRGSDKETLLGDHYEPLPGIWNEQPLSPKVDEIAAGSFKTKEPPEIEGSGYCIKSLEAALWAFHQASCFTEGLLLAVNLGDDADSTAAVYGQLAGAYYGISDIPERWTECVALRETIRGLAMGLHALAWKDSSGAPLGACER